MTTTMRHLLGLLPAVEFTILAIKRNLARLEAGELSHLPANRERVFEFLGRQTGATTEIVLQALEEMERGSCVCFQSRHFTALSSMVAMCRRYAITLGLDADLVVCHPGTLPIPLGAEAGTRRNPLCFWDA